MKVNFKGREVSLTTVENYASDKRHPDHKDAVSFLKKSENEKKPSQQKKQVGFDNYKRQGVSELRDPKKLQEIESLAKKLKVKPNADDAHMSESLVRSEGVFNDYSLQNAGAEKIFEPEMEGELQDLLYPDEAQVHDYDVYHFGKIKVPTLKELESAYEADLEAGKYDNVYEKDHEAVIKYVRKNFEDIKAAFEKQNQIRELRQQIESEKNDVQERAETRSDQLKKLIEVSESLEDLKMFEDEIVELSKTYLEGESLLSDKSLEKTFKKKRKGLKKNASLKIASYVLSHIKEEIKSLKTTL